MRQTEFFVILGDFLPFYQPPTNGPKIQNFEKWKTLLEILSFCTGDQKSQSYDMWFLRLSPDRVHSEICSVTEFFVFLDCFLPFYPTVNSENQNFEKMKKIPQNIIILKMCTINDSHMKYGSWDMECNGQNFLSFLIVFCLFTHPHNPKNQNFEKLKNRQDISLFYTCVP